MVEAESGIDVTRMALPDAPASRRRVPSVTLLIVTVLFWMPGIAVAVTAREPGNEKMVDPGRAATWKVLPIGAEDETEQRSAKFCVVPGVTTTGESKVIVFVPAMVELSVPELSTVPLEFSI